MSFWREVKAEVNDLPHSMLDRPVVGLAYPLGGAFIGGALGALYGNPFYTADIWADVLTDAALGTVGGLALYVLLWASYSQGSNDENEHIRDNYDLYNKNRFD